VGLLVPAALLDDVHVNAGSFFVAVLIFTVVPALMQPFSSRSSGATARRWAGWP
jgi:hypothetical protein